MHGAGKDKRHGILVMALVVVAIILLLTGIILAARDAPRRKGVLMAIGLAVAIFAAVGVRWATGSYVAPCDIESNYYCIKVLATS